jgi:hypothetical protein
MAFMSSNISLSTPPTVMPFDLEQVIRDISLRNSSDETESDSSDETESDSSEDDDLAILNSIMTHRSDETESDSSDETESIDSIKHASLAEFSIFKVVNSSENCGICYEKSDVKTPCLHSFCTSCITKWVCDEEKRNCPYCRFNFP